MPLRKIQVDVLKLLAGHRDPQSYVAGSSPLNRQAGRYSLDIDVFNDHADHVASAALNDTRVLAAAGYGVTLVRQLPGIHTAEVRLGDAATRVEWVADSDFRFFPTIRDPLFGYCLHPVDLAMNKATAAAGRRELRDIVDLVTIHETVLPLGAVVCAAVEKSLGFTPEGLIAEIRRNGHYPAAEWRALESDRPLDPVDVMKRLRSALEAAELFVARMPTDKIGLLFLRDGIVVQPDPDRLDDYQSHAGQRGGHWPTGQAVVDGA